MNDQSPITLPTRGIVPGIPQAGSSIRRNRAWGLEGLAVAVLLLICVPASAAAATAPSLGTAQSFAVLGASAVSNTGPSVVTGDLGISPGTASSVTGFPPGIVIGTTHFADAVAIAAQTSATAAYTNLAGQACNTTISADLGGMTLVPGVYCSATSMGLTGTVTLDAQGDPNAVFIFQAGSTLTTASGSSVRVINGGQSCNVFWQVGSSATLGTTTTFAGNILALTSITLTTGASASGRMIARTGAVTMDSNAISACSLAGPAATPTVGKAFSPASISTGSVSTLTITFSNPAASIATLTSSFVDTLPSGVVIAAIPNVASTCVGATPVAAAGSSTLTLPSGSSIPAGGSCTLSVNVTSATAGSYVNAVPVGALVTSNGNNASPAVATLTVVPLVGPAAPTLGKAFSPAVVNAGTVSTLTVTLSNPNATVATLTAPLVDTLPSGVVIAATPNAGTTCTGTGTPVAVAGGSSVTLPAGRSIPANSSCVLTVNVTAAVGGSFTNTLLAGALTTTNGSNAAPAISTLTVTPAGLPPPPPPLETPTLSEWAMILLAGLLAATGLAVARRRAK